MAKRDSGGGIGSTQADDHPYLSAQQTFGQNHTSQSPNGLEYEHLDQGQVTTSSDRNIRSQDSVSQGNILSASGLTNNSPGLRRHVSTTQSSSVGNNQGKSQYADI
jgi:hypothetical protein